MSKKAEIKKAFRRKLERRPDQSCTLERPDTRSASLSFGPLGYVFTFSEFDDEGDPATDTQHDEIYNAL